MRSDSPQTVVRRLSKPENVFLALILSFGFLFVFVTPPALVGDEPNHFFRAWQISEGQIIGEKRENLSGGWLPKSVLYTNRKLVGNIEMNADVKFDLRLITELIRLPLNREEKVFERFPNTVVYSPFPYAPQVSGILIGKIFDLSPLAMIYLARVFNLLFFSALAFFAIKKTPIHKWVFCLLSLTPTNVFQVASASVDAFTFGICFLAIAYFLHYALEENAEIKTLDIAKLFALCLLAVLSKNAYIFLPLIFLAVPPRKFDSIWKYAATVFALLFVCAGSVGLWSALVKPIYLPYRIDIPMNPEEQLRFILSDPFNFVFMAVADYVLNFKYYFITFFGQLTWFDLYVPAWLTVFVFVVVLSVAFFDKTPEKSVSRLSKSLFFAILVCTAFLISVLLYMTWSPVRGNTIEGIQGRYFIPVAPLFFLLFYNKKLEWKNFSKYVDKIAAVTVIFSLIITLYSIIERYYI